jgi:putrescine transport system ATP-binding protein
LDVAGNIAFGLHQERMDRRRIAARVKEMLALVQMPNHARRRPHELSGGQRQRVALARALAKMPKLLLLDEPLASLDRKLRGQTRLELTGIQERIGITFLVVTHDQEEALSMASRVAVMNHGRLAQVGTPAEIYERPGSRFVADFVGEVNIFEGELTTRCSGQALAVAGFDRPIPLPPDTNLADGTATALALRPEKLVLTLSPPDGFAVAASVSSTAYLGGGSIVHLRTDQGRALKAYLPGTAAGDFARGTRVWASWPPEGGVVLMQ